MIILRILNPATRYAYVVSFRPQPLYPRTKNPRYPLMRGPGVFHSRSARWRPIPLSLSAISDYSVDQLEAYQLQAFRLCWRFKDYQLRARPPEYDVLVSIGQGKTTKPLKECCPVTHHSQLTLQQRFPTCAPRSPKGSAPRALPRGSAAAPGK